MPEIEGLQFKITGSATGARNSLQATIDKLEQLKTKLSETKTEVSGLSKAISGLGNNTGFSRFNENLKKLNASRSLGTLVKNLKAVQSEMQGIGENIGAGLVKGIAANSGQLSSAAKQYIVDPVIAAVKSGFEIHSPSRVMAEIGGYLAAGLAEGIHEKGATAVNAMSSVVKQVTVAAKSAAANGGTYSDQLGDTALQGLHDAVAGIPAAASKAKKSISDLIDRSGYSDQLGDTPLQGLHNAIARIPAAAAKAKSALSDLIDRSGYSDQLGDTPLQGLHDAVAGIPAAAVKAKKSLSDLVDRSGYSDQLGDTPLQGLHDAIAGIPARAAKAKAALSDLINYGVNKPYMNYSETPVPQSLTNLKSEISSAVKTAQAGVTSTAKAAKQGLTSAVKAVPLGLASAVKTVKAGLSSAAASVKSGISGGAGKVKSGVTDAYWTGAHKMMQAQEKLSGCFSRAKVSISQNVSALKQYNARQKELDATFGATSKRTQVLVPQLGKMRNLLGGIGTGAKQTASAMGRLAAAPVKKLLSPLSAVQDKLKHIKYALLTVVTYGSIYRIISLFKTGLTDGLDNLYQYSLITGNQFAASMDRAATSLLYLKNSIGAAAAPLVNALAPALDFVVDKVVTLLNRFNQLVSALSGKTTYTKAVKQQTKYAEAVKDTSDAEDDAKKKADELKRSLTSFDEIHALDDNSSKDISSSKKNDSGTEIPDYGGMFTEENIDGGISDFAKNLKDTINKGDWQSLGKMLADKVNSAIDAIDWQGAGKKFGYGLNGIIQTSYYFLKYTDFAKIGNRFAQFLDMALAQVDFSKAGGLLVRKFTSLLDLIGGFLYGLNWGLVTKSITDFWTGFFDEWSAWLDEHDWTDVGEIFQRKLQQAIDNLGMDDIASSFWRAFNKSVDAAVDFNNGFYENISQELNGIMIALSGAAVGVGAILAFSGANITLGLAMMAWGGWEGYQAIKANWDSAMIDPVQKVVNTVLGILAPAQMAIGAILAFSGASLPLGIALMAAGAVELASIAALNWSGLSSNVKSVISTIAAFAGGALLALGVVLTMTGVMLPLGIALIAAGAIALVTSVALNWNKVKDGTSGVLGTILSTASKALLPLGIILALTGVALPLGIALIAVGAISLVAQKKLNWDSIGDKIKSILGTILGVVSKALLPLGAFLALTGVALPLGIALMAAGAVSLAKAKKPDWDTMKKNVGSALDNAKKTADDKLSKLKKAFSDAADAASKAWGDIKLKFGQIKLPSIKTVWSAATGALAQFIPGLPSFSLDWNYYAKGGFPDVGEMFIARENGSEMIGRMGNKNVVANNEQIVEGIARGVASANSQQNALLREQNELLRALLEKDTGISIGDITNAARRQNQRMGKTVIPVG